MNLRNIQNGFIKTHLPACIIRNDVLNSLNDVLIKLFYILPKGLNNNF